MTGEQKLKNAIGLSQRAGKCVSGEYAVIQAAQAGRAKLLLLDTAASENAVKRYTDLSLRCAVPLMRIEGLGHSIGKETRMAAAITDESFVRLIRNLTVKAEP